MALDRFQFTLTGGRFADLTGSPESVTIWVRGPEHHPILLGDPRKFAGYVQNDSGLMGYRFVLVCVPFGLTDGALDGHDDARYLQLLQVLAKRYKAITAVSGPDMVGLGGGAAQFWAQLLARFSDKIPVKVDGVDNRYDYQNHRDVTLNLTCRYPGVQLT